MKNNKIHRHLVSFQYQGKPGLQTNIEKGDKQWEFTSKKVVRLGG